MFLFRSLLRSFFSRHPRRYLFAVVLVVCALFVWEFGFVHIFNVQKHDIKHLALLRGPADHDHVHFKFSAPMDYLEIPDAELTELNTSSPLRDASKAADLCRRVGDKCKGFISIKSRGSSLFVLVFTVGPLGKGVNTFFLKSRFVKDVKYRDNYLTCAVPMTDGNTWGSTSSGCKLPKLDPFDKSVQDFISPMDPMVCEGEVYTSYYNNVLKADAQQTGFPVDRIVYQSILRMEGTDIGYYLGDEKQLPLDSKGVKLNEDFLQVTTYLKDGESQTDMHAHVAPKEEVLKRPRKDSGIPLNIIILGMDGNSDANVQRLLPDTYTFLRDELNAFIFKGFSLLGEATTPQLTGLLTGRSVEDNCALHEARKGITDEGTVDDWPFIFKTLKEHGYVTMFSEDAPAIGAFHLRLNGFNTQPCDHYGRYFWWAVPQEGSLGLHDNCINAQAQHMMQLNYLRSLFTAYPNTPKFGFTFLGSLCHQTLNMVSSAADDIHLFLRSLKDDGRLNDSMLVVLGDHGARFDGIRATLQGKLEERLPFLSIVLPEWFRKKYPNLVQNLKDNTERIISPLDVHATFMHILKYPTDPSKSTLSRGSSLFEKIPRTRECKDAGIPEHFCPCILWKPIATTHPHIVIGAHLTMAYINTLLTQDDKVKGKCHGLQLDTILSAVQEMPNKKVQLFKGIKDGIGLGVGEPLYDEEYNELECSYQIQFRVRPSMGIFESTVQIKAGRFFVDSNISRVNRYGNQPECIKESHPFLRKFCLCRH